MRNTRSGQRTAPPGSGPRSCDSGDSGARVQLRRELGVMSYQEQRAALNPSPGGQPLGPIQTKGPSSDVQLVKDSAAEGLGGSSSSLPHLEPIQRCFGSHDVTNVQAHVGGPATSASEKMGALAYTTGNHVAFKRAPDLDTAAHEAAHVVQQRGGVQLKGGVGSVGDRYEQHADAVADRVVQGQSAEGLLREAGTASAGLAAGPVQMMRDSLLSGDDDADEELELEEDVRLREIVTRVTGEVRERIGSPGNTFQGLERGGVDAVLNKNLYDKNVAGAYRHGESQRESSDSPGAGRYFENDTTRGQQQNFMLTKAAMAESVGGGQCEEFASLSFCLLMQEDDIKVELIHGPHVYCRIRSTRIPGEWYLVDPWQEGNEPLRMTGDMYQDDSGQRLREDLYGGPSPENMSDDCAGFGEEFQVLASRDSDPEFRQHFDWVRAQVAGFKQTAGFEHPPKLVAPPKEDVEAYLREAVASRRIIEPTDEWPGLKKAWRKLKGWMSNSEQLFDVPSPTTPRGTRRPKQQTPRYRRISLDTRNEMPKMILRIILATARHRNVEGGVISDAEGLL